MLAGASIMLYRIQMTSHESSVHRLEFRDGEDVLLTHLNGTRRAWTQDDNSFSKAYFFDDHIEFRQLDDDGEDITSQNDVKREYTKPHYFRSFGKTSFNAAVLMNGEWTWNCIGVPLPETVESFKNTYINPLGTAHDFSFDVRPGNGKDGEFCLGMIIDMLAEGKLPIGADAGYFAHDMTDHSVGLASIDSFCMNALRSLAQMSIDQRKTDPAESHDLSLSIATNLDYYSFHRFFVEKMAPGRVDPLLTQVWRYTDFFSEASLEQIASILKQNGYYTTKNMKVVRSNESIKHYSKVVPLLDPTQQ